MRSGLLCVILVATTLVNLAAQEQPKATHTNQVVLKYFGAAGWEITDGTTTILIDPYLSRINGPPPPEGHRMVGDTRRAYDWGDVATPDVAAIDSHIQQADFVLVTHTHYDHILDVPHIALKTGAAVIGSESTENVMRAYSVSEKQLITVRGGEDYDFNAFSLKVIPSIHSALDHKHYFNGPMAGDAPRGLKAPLKFGNFVEGGSVAYLLRLAGHQVLIMGSMNYIEREMEGLRP